MKFILLLLLALFSCTGTPIITDEEERNYRAKCEEGSGHECFVLAGLAEGLEDISEAKKYYRKACDRGYTTGCLRLGALRMNKIESEQGETIVENACKQNDEMACRFLDQRL